MEKTLQESLENEKNNEGKELAIWDLGSPLYDSYEVVSLGHLIERHIMIFPSMKILSPPSSDSSVPVTLAMSSAVKGARDRSSIAKTWSKLARPKLWRKRSSGQVVGDIKGDDMAKKPKCGVLLRGFSNRFGL